MSARPALLVAPLGLALLAACGGGEAGGDVSGAGAAPTAEERDAEELSSRVGERLGELAAVFVADPELTDWDADAWCAPDFVARALRPDGASEVTHGGLAVRRWTRDQLSSAEAPRDGAHALRELFSPLASATDRRAKFKVIGVDVREGGLVDTEVLVQTFGRLGAGALQQDASWSMTWRAWPDDAPPALVDIRPTRLDEVRTDRVRFVERTGAVLAEAGGSTEVLGRGCGFWSGRTDNLGEPDVFGHNGIAVGDVNGDGLEDLYVATGTGRPNLLFVQRADGTVVERGHESGVAWLDDTKGVLLIDYDGDGDRDLACAIGPAIVISENDGTGLFTPQHSLRAATDAAFYSLSAADYDLDGDLDLFAVRYVKTSYGDSVPMPFHDATNGPRNHLLRNDGEAGFVDVTDVLGLGVAHGRFSLASAWTDYDSDGDPDLYVANDFGRNELWRNDGDRFVNAASEAGVEDQAAGMGVSWGDVDADGDLDLLVSNMFSSAGRRVAYQPGFRAGVGEDVREGIRRHSLGNSLFLNRGDGTFEDRSEAAGIRMGRWAWGALLTDLDADGLPDMVVPNGFVTNDKPDDL